LVRCCAEGNLAGQTKAQGVSGGNGAICDVSVAVPGLGVGGGNGSEASGVGRDPACLIGILFAKEEIVKSGGGVLILAGERRVDSAGLG
jgi:hypothetical protein